MKTQFQKPKRRQIQVRVFCLIACVALLSRVGRAEWIIDPEPPMTWEAMLACPLVVVAKYESHQDNLLTLKVTQVLKGQANPGQTLRVTLEHLYTLETGHVGWQLTDPRGRAPDGVPKLCYKRQFSNPGDLVPHLVVSDSRQAALYFFPEASRPALKRLEQVQPARFREGWQQALAGQPMSLYFTLAQSVSKDVARNALEELGKTREPACLNQLFDGVLNPALQESFRSFDAASPLSFIGDRDGDVYDRAATLLRQQASGTNEVRFYSLAMIMAAVNPSRAARDLPRFLADDNPLVLRMAALAGLGRVPEREAVQLAIDRLRDQELADSALWSIRGQLRWDSDFRFPKVRGIQDRDWILHELRVALGDDKVPAGVRERIGQYFGQELRQMDALDIDLLRKRLSDPGDRIYHGWADGQTAELLRDAEAACDPRVVPILAEILNNVPAAANRAYGFQEKLRFYANICPRAMRRELERRKLPDRLAAIPIHERSYLIRETMELVGIWKPMVPDVLQTSTKRCFDLAKRVSEGDAGATDDLLRAADELIVGYGDRTEAARALLAANSPAARQHYLAYVQAARRGEISGWTHERIISSDLAVFLNALFPERTDEYFEQVGQLLRSDSLLERKAGVDSLQFTLKCDFDFNPLALAAERTSQLARMKPVFKSLEAKTELEARTVLLAHFGFVLDGQPDATDWLPILKRAAAGTHEGAAANAIRVVEMIVGGPSLRRLEQLPPRQRAHALAAFIDDSGAIH